MDAEFEHVEEDLLETRLAVGLRRCGTPEVTDWFEERITGLAREGREYPLTELLNELWGVESREFQEFLDRSLFDGTLTDIGRTRIAFALQKGRSAKEVENLLFRLLEADAVPAGWANAATTVAMRGGSDAFLTRMAETVRARPGVVRNASVFGNVVVNAQFFGVDPQGPGMQALRSAAAAIADDPRAPPSTRDAARQLARELALVR